MLYPLSYGRLYWRNRGAVSVTSFKGAILAVAVGQVNECPPFTEGAKANYNRSPVDEIS